MHDMNSSSPAGGPKSFLQRFAGVFTGPGEVFEDIASKPDFIKPLLLLIAVSLAITETMLWKIGMPRILHGAITQSGRASSLSPEQLHQAVEKSAAVATVLAHLGGLFGVPIFLLAVAGVGMIILNGVFGVHADFKKIFSVACYADLPSVVSGAMAVAVIFFGDPDHFNPRSPAPTNLGFFLNPLEASHPVMALASSFDIFIFWFLILLAIGLSRVSGGMVKTRSIFFIYLGFWILLVAVKVVLAAFT
ncbi:MAG TPA: YIP1 family protein [Terriglobia bacterium]|nr:YIP1 family protein [Terriglobia bacterium]